MKITDLFLKNIKAQEKQKNYWDEGLRGFGVRVSPKGTKTFIVLVASGSPKAIGRYPLLSLKDAREEAKKLLAHKMLGKVNPSRVPYEEARDAFVTACERKNKPTTVKGYRQGLDAHFKFGRKSITDITEFHIRQVLNNLDDQPSTKHHAFTTFRVFLNWCMAEGLLETSPMLRMKPPQLPKSRDRILTKEELTEIWNRAYYQMSFEDKRFKNIVLLLILTGQRKGEIGNLQWDWIGEDSINLPWTITKNKRPNVIPLTPQIEKVLDEIPNIDDCPFLFPASRKVSENTTVFNGWSKSKARFDEQCKVTNWTLHDLRRTVATNLAEMGIAQLHVEKLLNHVSGGEQSQIASIYNRYEYQKEIKEALVKWHDYLDTLTEIPFAELRE